MPETPARQKGETKRPDAGGPQFRRELAQAAASLELSDLDVSEALPGELLEIMKARGQDRGSPVTIGELVRMEESGQEFPSPGPETFFVLERISARCRIRHELDLTRDPCAKPEDGTVCSCQTQAIGALLADGVKPTRRRIAQLARAHHRSPGKRQVPPLKLEPVHLEVFAEPQETNGHVEDPLPAPEPKPEQKPKPEPPNRVIHRVRRWYDEAERPRFSDMRF
jgi:hypothetical protein